MAFCRFVFILAVALLGVLSPAAAQIVYSPVNVSIPVGGSYYLDVNRDGVTDFTVRSQLLQDYCQFGDGYAWNLSITPGAGDSVVVTTDGYVAALPAGARIDSSRNFSPDAELLTGLAWGLCGTGISGPWLNLPNRYVGLQLRLRGANDIHYGWAKLSDAGYIDHDGHLHASTFLQGFAYQTAPDVAIMAGAH